MHLDEDIQMPQKLCFFHTHQEHTHRQMAGVKPRPKRESLPLKRLFRSEVFLISTAYSVEKRVVSNLTHASQPDSKLAQDNP